MQNACDDTCPKCFILKNKFIYLGMRNTVEISVISNDELPEDFAADEALFYNENLHAEQIAILLLNICLLQLKNQGKGMENKGL
jgi:hypothetical protein